MTEESNGRKAAAIATRLGSAGVGAGVGLFVAGPFGAVGGALLQEALNEYAPRLIDAVDRRRSQAVAQVVAVGANTADMDLDRFSDAIEGSPELLSLLAETVQAAMETPLEAKIYALGVCLGTGVEDDTRDDAARLRVRGLARIEPQEAKLMALLDQPNPNGRDPWLGWNRDEILEHLPGLAEALDACMALLVAEGLATDAGVGGYGGGGPGREQWNLTDFGRECLRLLQALTPTPEPQADQQP
ncbi:hypothetical protein [Streptomyces umbrinus]|uniref:hypothetical protein n=1 Tax=Streptomyces umbrinus TaxID=67370 RepID=UPI0033C215AF